MCSAFDVAEVSSPILPEVLVSAAPAEMTLSGDFVADGAVANGLNGSRDLHLPSELLTTRCCAYPREIERTSHGKPMLK